MENKEVTTTKKEKNHLIKRLTSGFCNNITSKDDLLESISKAAKNKVIDQKLQNMLQGAIKISSLDVNDIMISHTKIIALDMSMSVNEILEKTILSTHTRLPVYCEDKVDVLGVIHAKDLLKLIFKIEMLDDKNSELETSDIKSVLRPAIFVPETKKLDAMLKDFKNSQNHMAIVVDEYGAISGLITIEDILEEIVGDIDDEFDTIDESIKKLDNDRFLIDATTTIEDFNEYFNTSIDEDNDFDTIAGMIIQTLEYLPEQNESIVVDGLKFTINEADKRKIINIVVEQFKKP